MSQATLALTATPGVPAERITRPPKPGAPGAPAFPNFTYHGGPVITCPQVYTSFWGSLWTTDPGHIARAARLNQFHQDLLKSQFMNVLSQYGVSTGAGQGSVFVRSTFLSNVPNHLTDGAIQSNIQSLINSKVLPEPGSPSLVALVIYVDNNNTGIDGPSGITMCEGSAGDFGYHFSFKTAAGNQFFYAVIPALTDTCLNQTCGNSPTCSLHLSQTQEQRQTQVASHEFAEMTTNPQWNPPNFGWIDPVNSEVGDICNGNSATITVGSNTWTVQAIYSKTDDTNSNGAKVCVATAPNPLPKLSPGPASPAAGAGDGNGALPTIPVDRLLPGLPVHFDAASGKVSLPRREIQDYVNRLFHPFHYSQLVPNLPDVLREVADFLDGK